MRRVESRATSSSAASPRRYLCHIVGPAPDGSAWFAAGTCEPIRLAPGAAPGYLPSPIPATQLAFAPNGDVLLASPARLVRTPISALSITGCDGMPPTTTAITVGGKDADGRDLAASRHRGLRISVREPAAIDALAFYSGRLGRQVNTTVTAPAAGRSATPCRKGCGSSNARSPPASTPASTSSRVTDREGNAVQIGAKVRLTP